MKILHVAKIVGIAGAENYLLKTLPELSKIGVEVEFLCLTPKNKKGSEEKFCQALKSNNINIHKFYYKSLLNLKVKKQLNGIINLNSFDLVHSHLIHADLLMAYIKLISKSTFKLVSTKHGHDESYTNNHGFNPKGKKVLKYHFAATFSEKRMHKSFAISNGLRNLFIQHGICDASKIDTIHYGFDYKNESVKATPKLSKNQLILVGRFTELKGHKVAVDAINELKKEFPDIRLLFVGNGYYEDEIKKYVDNKNLVEYISFLGYKTNSIEYMKSSDVVLIPSKAEGFGLVALEAFSVKKPVVCFNVPALNEIIIHEKTGMLVQPYQLVGFIESIRKLLLDKDLAEEMGENAYLHQKKNFSMDSMIKKTLNFYNSCLVS